MKGPSKMLKIILLLTAIGLVGCLITWGVIAYLGRSQSLTVKSIENPSGDFYLIHLEKPRDLTWEAASYAKIALPEVEESGEKSRWLTLASNSDENEVLLLTRNSGSLFKQTLTGLPKGSQIKLSWVQSLLIIKDDQRPLVCFASDVGIAAIRPIATKWAGHRSITISHLDKGCTVFDRELTKLDSQSSQFTYNRSKSLAQSEKELETAVKRYHNKAYYLLAGQPDDLKSLKTFLENSGVDSQNIKMETFTGLK